VLVDQYGLIREDEPVLEFLNAGGPPEAALAGLQALVLPLGERTFRLTDLTADGVAELVLGFDNLYVIGCRAGRFQTMQSVFQEGGPVRVEAIEDMNLDGLLDIVMVVPFAGVDLVKIFSWDGAGFVSLVYDERSGWDSAEAKVGLSVLDYDGNGTLELLVDNTDIQQPYEPYFDASCWAPARVTSEIFEWDGERFTLSRHDVDAPTYRFQAALDADRLTLEGRYQEAGELYQRVINDESLEWWSPDRRDYLLDTEFGLDTYGFTTPPEPDPYERVSLSAYATYRLMLLGILSGDDESAKTEFDKLQQNDQTDTAWYVFSGLANEFWQEYQGSNDLVAACGRAVAFVESSPVYQDEVFWALFPGSCEAGPVAAEICPFQ
jgi:hypothetical protein